MQEAVEILEKISNLNVNIDSTTAIEITEKVIAFSKFKLWAIPLAVIGTCLGLMIMGILVISICCWCEEKEKK